MRWKYPHGLNIQHWLSTFYKALSFKLSMGSTRKMKADIIHALAIAMDEVKSQL